jgi:hypothetical protein
MRRKLEHIFGYKVKWETGYIVVEFTEVQHPEVDMEQVANE